MSLPTEGEHHPIPEESWTVDMWKAITADWSAFHRKIVKLVASQPFENRLRAGGEFFEARFNEDSDPDEIAFSEFLARVCSMPDTVLARIVESLPEDVEDVDTHIVIPKQSFRPFENARGFLPDNGIGSIVLLKMLDFGDELRGDISAVRVTEDGVMCTASILCYLPNDFRRLKGINLLGNFRGVSLSANFGNKDNSIETEFDFFQRQLEDGGTLIRKFVTGFHGLQRRIVGLPYDLNALRSDLSFTLQPSSNP